MKVFTIEGEHVVTFGRSGRGPGEFLAPVQVRVDSLLHVYDAQQMRVSAFDLDGKHLRTTRLPTLATFQIGIVSALPSGTQIAETIPRFSSGLVENQPDVLVLAIRRGDIQDTLARYNAGATVWYTPNQHAPWGLEDVGFGPGGAWAVCDSALVLVDGYTATIRFLRERTNGQFVTSSERALPGPSRPVRPEDLEGLEDTIRNRRRRERRTTGEIAFIPPPRWSVGQRVLCGPLGETWVMQGTNGASGERWTLIAADGTQRTWNLPAGARLHDVTTNWLAIVTTLESGVPVVQIYERLDRP